MKMQRDVTAFADAISVHVGCRVNGDFHPAAESFSEDVRSLEGVGRLLGHSITAMLSSSDMDALIDGVARRVAADTSRYDTDHRSVTRLLSAPNFKPLSIARVAGGTLQARKEGEQSQQFQWTAERETTSVVTYSAASAFTRESAINSEWDLLANLAQELTAGGYRRERAELVTVVEANGTLSDGVAQFDGSRGNVQTGTLSVATVGAAMSKLRALAGADGTPLELAPGVLMVPGDAEADALTIVESMGLMRRVRVWADSRLSAAYLCPDPMVQPVFGIVHIDRSRDPIVNSKRQPRTDSWTLKAVHDCCAVALTPRAVKMTIE